jgi:hypothetical protein
MVRVTCRNVMGFCLIACQYAPFDMLGAALDDRAVRLRQARSRWRASGYARSNALAPGVAWCWLMSAWMTACGCPWEDLPAALARAAHVRAVLTARLRPAGRMLTSLPGTPHLIPPHRRSRP